MAAIAIEISEARLTSIDIKLPMRRLHDDVLISAAMMAEQAALLKARLPAPCSSSVEVEALDLCRQGLNGMFDRSDIETRPWSGRFSFLVNGTIFYIRTHKKYHSLYNYIAQPILLFCELRLIALVFRWTPPPYSLRYLGVEKNEK